MKIYVASSRRNLRQPRIVQLLRKRGHQVYDFRHPSENNEGFAGWEAICPDYKTWTPRQFLKALQHPFAAQHFAVNMAALDAADAVILVLPCGRSAHLELGYAVGKGKPTAILLDQQNEPELMYKMAGFITDVETALWNWSWLQAGYITRALRKEPPSPPLSLF